jgi:hypothetical protein
MKTFVLNSLLWGAGLASLYSQLQLDRRSFRFQYPALDSGNTTFRKWVKDHSLYPINWVVKCNRSYSFLGSHKTSLVPDITLNNMQDPHDYQPTKPQASSLITLADRVQVKKEIWECYSTHVCNLFAVFR